MQEVQMQSTMQGRGSFLVDSDKAANPRKGVNNRTNQKEDVTVKQTERGSNRGMIYKYIVTAERTTQREE
jgi:hypothetical protein